MITLIELAFLVYWCRTFFLSMDDARVYRQRVMVTAAMLALLWMAGQVDSKELVAGLCGLAVAIETWCFVAAFLDYDERLFPRRAT